MSKSESIGDTDKLSYESVGLYVCENNFDVENVLISPDSIKMNNILLTLI